MKNLILPFAGLLAMLVISSCHPGGPEEIEEMDVVYTDYDPEFDFTAPNTFAIPDSIVLIEDQRFVANPGDTVPEFVDPAYADLILDKIRENMLELGWVEVDKTENPDAILLATASKTTNLTYNYDPGYWNWWYPGSYGGYASGWYYPGYSPGYISGYQTGSLMIQMASTETTGANNTIPVVWLAFINGVLEGSDQNKQERLIETIDQAYDQSPYLNQ